MAEIVASAVVQEAVGRGVSFVMGKRKEKSMSQGHIMERLEMAVNELELAVERSAKLPITDVSLLGRRKIIKSAYMEAMEQLDKHKPRAVSAGQQQVAQGVKRPRWMFLAKDKSITPFAGLSINDVRRFEWYADCARKFVSDVESGCSLHHYSFCIRIVRHLPEGKALQYYHLEQGNLLRYFFIWPVYSDERGVEAVLGYCYEDNAMAEKCFALVLFLRLSESTDIVAVATKGLQLLTSGFKLAAECAMGELTLLSNLQEGIAHSSGPLWKGIREAHIECTQFFRPDPTCCKGNRHGLCANNNVPSELSDIFQEQVIFWGFRCYYVPTLEPRSSCSSFDVMSRSKSRGGVMPPLALTAAFAPHDATETEDSYALVTIGDDREYRVASIQQVVEALKSEEINCFFYQPELTEYGIFWRSKHGGAGFWVDKASTKRAGAQEVAQGEVAGGSLVACACSATTGLCHDPTCQPVQSDVS